MHSRWPLEPETKRMPISASSRPSGLRRRYKYTYDKSPRTPPVSLWSSFVSATRTTQRNVIIVDCPLSVVREFGITSFESLKLPHWGCSLLCPTWNIPLLWRDIAQR
jgi:hypothetical protein